LFYVFSFCVINLSSHHLRINSLQCFAFNALTLMVGGLEEHPACKTLSDELMEWISVWSEMQMICMFSS